MSVGGSSDQASLHLGQLDEDGQPIDVPVELPSPEDQIEAHNGAYVEPDKTDWVACLPECHWADDGSGQDTGRSTPEAIHAEGCPHSGGRYIESIPAPSRH